MITYNMRRFSRSFIPASLGMIKYILKRFVQSVVTLFIVVTIVFLLLRLMPEEGYFGTGYDKLTYNQREAILNEMGLRDPVPTQLKNFYGKLLQGNLGISYKYQANRPITKILKAKIPYSLTLGLTSMAISLVLGLAIGVAMARSKNKIWDKLGTAFVVFIMAVPAAIYYLFIQIYATSFMGLPMLFNASNPKSWVLPILSMSLGGTASYAMWMRRYMVDELNKDYVKLARAKGYTDAQIMRKHVFRNAFVPMVQYLPTSLLFTIAGSIYIESLYSIPGMGGLLVDVIQRQDNTVVQALVLIYSSIGIVGLFLGDILMSIVDPRIRLDAKEDAR